MVTCVMDTIWTLDGMRYVAFDPMVENQRWNILTVMNGSGAGKCTTDKSEERLRNINYCPRGRSWWTPKAKMV